MPQTLNNKKYIAWISIIYTSFLLGCGGGGGGGTNASGGAPAFTGTTPQSLNVTINWAANKELRVNQSGGGYNVYISQTSGFDIADGGITVINVPWASGTLAPTSQLQSLSSGTYYVRVAAYTAFPVANTSSAASPQITVNVPFTLP